MTQASPTSAVSSSVSTASEPTLPPPPPELHHAEHRIGLQIIATLAGGMILICSVVAGFLFQSSFHSDLLAIIAAILLSWSILWDALSELIEGKSHMNVLVALAVAAAFATGNYSTAAAIAFVMTLAGLIEKRTAHGAHLSIESLVRITPTKANKLTDAGEAQVEASQLSPGDTVRVRPGDIIPADGRVAVGQSTVNQANITGESFPADKTIGDTVFSGTINLTGQMDITVTTAGQDTTLGRVKDLILQAKSSRIPIMRLIDQYAKWYTPTMLMLAAIVWFFTYRTPNVDPWARVISMLVIACPLALILATPTAMVAGLTSAARLGVYIKSVVDLEAARNLTAMIFDKTGTLTTGQLEVAKLSPAPGVEGANLLHAAACVEQNSNHPVARAVTNVARRARLSLVEPTDFEEVPGQGVLGRVEGEQVAVGRASWIQESGHVQLADDQGRELDAMQASPEAQGLSTLFVIRNGRLLGWIGLADNTRAEATSSMDTLRKLGIKRLFIVTGDRESVAKRVAEQMHTEYKAEVLPHQKLEMVDQLKKQGHRVAMVGDGVNDAPALAAGDISIAMGAAGSDVALHSANIALTNNNLTRIPFLIRLSRMTVGVITQNLVFSVLFIIVGQSLAAAGKIDPIWAAMLSLGSGLVVIFNSARLVRSGEDIEHQEAQQAAEMTRAAGA